MIQQTINDWKQQAKVRYQASPLPAFFAWWGAELSPIVPGDFKKRLMPPAPSLWLVPSQNGDLVVWADQSGLSQVDTFQTSEDAKLLADRWKALVDGFDQGVPRVVLCLPSDAVLDRLIELPLALEANLKQSIQYQLDQLTPFDPNGVYFDHQIKKRDSKNGRLSVDLRVLPIQSVVDWLDRLEAIGIGVHIIDCLSTTAAEAGPPARAGFNLLPEAKRPPYRYQRAQLNLRLAGVAFLVLVGLMGSSLYLRERSVTRLGLQVDALRAEAQAVMSLQSELGNALDAANFLAQKRMEAPVMVHLLDEVTRLLPEHMWLQQMQVRGDELTMMGYAEGSQQLIELINDAPLLKDAAFRGRVTVDPDTSQERFTVQAVIDRGDAGAVATRSGE